MTCKMLAIFKNMPALLQAIENQNLNVFQSFIGHKQGLHYFVMGRVISYYHSWQFKRSTNFELFLGIMLKDGSLNFLEPRSLNMSNRNITFRYATVNVQKLNSEKIAKIVSNFYFTGITVWLLDT